jgi:hypothetical protein
MVHLSTPRFIVCLTAFAALTLAASSARADIPAGYKGLPFDPKVAGGPTIPPSIQAGPYTIPGRLDFINYDLGGDGVGYHTGDHVTNNGSESVKLALGYRTDAPTATLCLTNQVEKDDWYMTSPTLDGTPFPSATTADYYIGAVQVGDWFNFTVNVLTPGTYTVSSTWASGNGPPGGEGGDGAMGLEVFSNGTLLGSWTATFPDYMTEANFHNWMAFPNFVNVTLQAGVQVIKLQSTSKHLNTSYVVFALVQGDGGSDNGDSATGSSSGTTASASGSSSGLGSGETAGGSGASGSGISSAGASEAASGDVSLSGSASSGIGSGSTNGDTGVGNGGTNGSAGANGGSGTSGAAAPSSAGGGSASKGGSGCNVAAQSGSEGFGFVLGLMGLALAGLRWRGRRPIRRSPSSGAYPIASR